MAATDDADDGRLAGRTPRAARSGQAEAEQGDRGDEAIEGEEIDTVNRIMGFLRGDDGEGEGPA